MDTRYMPGYSTTTTAGRAPAAAPLPGAAMGMAMRPSGPTDDTATLLQSLVRKRAMLAMQRPQGSRPTAPARFVPTNDAMLGGGGQDWREQHARDMAREELIAARERNAPLPTKTPFWMNASSSPNGSRVPDWDKVSLGNLPSSGGFAQSPQVAAAGDQALYDARKARFDQSSAIGARQNAIGGGR